MDKKIIMGCLLSLSIFGKCQAMQLELQSLKEVDLTQSYMQDTMGLLSVRVNLEAQDLDRLLPSAHTKTNQGLEAIFKVMFIATLYKNASNVPEVDESRKQMYENNLRTLVTSLLYGNYFSHSCSDTVGQINFLNKKEELQRVTPGSLREVLVKTLGNFKTPNDCPLRSAFGK